MNENYILSLIGRVHRQGNRFIERELRDRGLDIAPSHGDILFRLFYNDTLTMQEIARLVNRDKSTVTVLVEKLVKRGYVQKEKNPQDARVYQLSLTEEGRGLRVAFEEISASLIAEVYKNFTPEEKKQLIHLLQKIQL